MIMVRWRKVMMMMLWGKGIIMIQTGLAKPQFSSWNLLKTEDRRVGKPKCW